jgi:hypothetical protein
MGSDSVMKSMDWCRKVHDFLVSGQQNPIDSSWGNFVYDARPCLTPIRYDKNVRGHLLITFTGLASLQDAGCRGVFSGGIARWARPPATRCHPSGMKKFRVGVIGVRFGDEIHGLVWRSS